MSSLPLRFALLLTAAATSYPHAFGQTTAPAVAAAAVETDEADDAEQAAPEAPEEDPSLKFYWDAQKLFRSTQAPDLARGRELLKQAADAENSHAENYLGLCLQNGLHGFAREPKKAVTWFMLSAQRGNAFAKVNLGLCYASGTGIRKDPVKAREWLEAALADNADFSAPRPPEDFFTTDTQDKKADDADTTLSGERPVDTADRYRAAAHAALGDICEKQKQYTKAQEHYVKAATAGENGRAGVRAAAMKAAFNYAFGTNIPRDITKANELIEQSKKLSRHDVGSIAHGLVEQKRLDDFAQADFEEEVAEKTDEIYQQVQAGIAGTFADPKSKNYDPREAARWFEIAAESGHTWAMLSLADLYQGKSLGAPDPASVFKWYKEAAERGNHMTGWANLAICYQNGYGTEKDTAKAAEIFKKYKEDSIICYLGGINQCPPAVLNFDQELALNRTWAKNKDPHACFLMGMRYMNGWGVKVDIDDGESWLKRATKANYGPAWRELGTYYLTRAQVLFAARIPGSLDERKRALECFEKATAANDPQGMARLADMHAPGSPGEVRFSIPPVNEKRAEALYLQCLLLDPENGHAHNNLAVIYGNYYNRALRSQRSIEASEYRDKLVSHYEAANKAKVSTAAWNLGNLYYDGVLGEKDYQTAYTYFEAAATDGQVEARRRLGEMHEKGLGVSVTYREAAYHYRLAALQGDMESLTRLCTFYLQGKGVSRDLDRASMWLTMLANRGRIGALVTFGDIMISREQYSEAFTFFNKLLGYENTFLQGAAYDRLSRLYTIGKGVKANPSKAKRYHEKAITLGNSEAIYSDAMTLVSAKNYEGAVPLLKRSANAGSSNAEYQLSALYFGGNGVPKDLEQAIKHCLNAAENGHVDAQYSLSVLSLKNTPGAPDLEQAIRYAESAENAGHAKAGYVRKKLEEKREKTAPGASENARSL